MKKLAALLLVVFVASACSDASGPATSAAPSSSPALARSAGEGIPNEYIVVLDDATSDVPGVAAGLARAHGASLRFTYTSAIKGFAATMSAAAAEAIARNPQVAYVEQDQVYSINTTQSSATWGLDRIDQRSRPLSGTYTYTRTGSGVRAYIIDTGIYTSHTQFGSRASNVYDAFGGNGSDCNGHGTHVAGTVGSSTYGVAKAALLRGVRVLDCSGNGATSGIISAIDWVRANHIKPAVANMSLGGGYSSSLNTAAANLHNAGVFLAVAAGNENQDACNVSPASAAYVFTTASSTSSDYKSSFSNWGSCVEAYAPGSSITSTWNNGGTNTISGTSMASPHVAGVAALYKHAYGDASSATIRSWIINNATTSVISGNVTGTPNRLLFKSSL